MSSPQSHDEILVEFGLLLDEFKAYPEGSTAYLAHRAKVYHYMARAINRGVSTAALAEKLKPYTNPT